MRDFIGALSISNVKKGVFVTTSDFDAKARAAAGTQNIILINGKVLAKLMINYNVGVSGESCYYIKKLDMDYFED